MSESPQREFELLCREVSSQLLRAGIAYLKLGLQTFHEAREGTWQVHQTSVGNIATAIELILKSLIAEKAPAALFVGLPTELQVYLSRTCDHPEIRTLPAALELKLRHLEFDTIMLDECIAIAYILSPELKLRLRSRLKLVRVIRNKSIHSALPDFSRFEMDRLAYSALQLMKALSELMAYKTYEPREADESFISDYDDNRIQKVDSALAAARDSARNLKPITDSAETLFSSWEEMAHECPVCSRMGYYFGETEHKILGFDGEDVDGELMFLATSYYCSACGLSLDEVEDLGLAGMEDTFDRSEEWQEYARDVLGEERRWYHPDYGYI